MAVSPADSAAHRSRARVPGHHDHRRSLRRAARHRAVRRQTARRSSRSGRSRSSELAKCPNVRREDRRHRDADQRLRLSQAAIGRRRPTNSLPRAATTTDTRSTCSAPTAACSRATSRSTRQAARIERCGTRSRRSRPVRRQAEKAALFHDTAARVYRLGCEPRGTDDENDSDERSDDRVVRGRCGRPAVVAVARRRERVLHRTRRRCHCTSPFTVKFGVKGMEIAPAGTDEPNSGHHHLLIDVADRRT